MAATHTLTGSFADLLGDSFNVKNVHGYVEASERVVVDTDVDGAARFGRKSLTINTDGTWSVAGLPDTADLGWNPSGFALRLVVDYRDGAQGTATRSQSFTSNWFPLTADTDFKDVVDIELVAVDDELRQTIHQWALDAQAAAEAAGSAVASARVASTVTYADGLPATETIPLTTGGSLVKTYHWDPEGNPTTADWNYPAGPDYIETFTYDSDGNATGSTFAEV